MKLTRWLVLILMVGNCAAQDVKIVGKIEQAVKLAPSTAMHVQSEDLHVTLLKIQLSDKAQHTVIHRVKNLLANHPAQLKANVVAEIQLGMNQVPVLNQGSHGSCVAFANTAAIDAALNKGDYISQLCQLELGLHLEKNAYSASGWNGSWGPNILNQMRVFGIVTKDKQRSIGCNGVREYPVSGPDSEVEMSVMDYHAMSEPLPQDAIGWSSLLDLYQVAYDHFDTSIVLNQVKMALSAGDRLTFGVLFLDLDQGMVGAVGSHRGRNDSWVLTPEIAQDINAETEFAGHEMVITGFNDQATALDNEGRVHKGLLTLRNSWGNRVGHEGDFYMSYDYFKALVLEVQRIRTLTSTDVIQPT